MILTQQNLTPEALLRFFEKHFPEKEWFYLDLYSDEETTHHLRNNSMGFYTVATGVKSYPLEIGLTETDEDIVGEYQVKIAKSLSEKYQMKTVIDFTHPKKPDDPYYSLLFDAGHCFLVDDSDWEETGEFVVLEPWAG
ncbi:hypothetical protein [Maribacter sp. 2307ULW6-5]|uniref:hypothetical protein n=1 Tax=Maribacter sp. 2307ULW6-5 TaxID=3386275 RepID=UPI0039BD70D4